MSRRAFLLESELTDAELAQRLAEDPRYCIESFFWIIDKERKRVPFIFNGPQAEYYKNRTSWDLILKARKEGFSSAIEALFLHACLFQKNVRAVTMSHEMESTVRHFERVRYYLEHMGPADNAFVFELDKESEKQIRFKATGSSYWIGTAGARGFGRGDDITHLHLSEVAHYVDQSVLTGVMEACVPNAWRVMETTAKGVGEAFHRLWQAAKDPQSGTDWKAHFFSWFDDPTNTLKIPEGVRPGWNAEEQRMIRTYHLSPEQMYWYRKKQASMTEPEKMPQEYPSTDTEAFLTSGAHLFNQIRLAEMKKKCQAPTDVGAVEDDGRTVAWVDDPEGKLRVWKHPRQGRMYLISADVAEGVQDGDYSVAQVIDRASWEQVAVWRGRTDPGSFGKVLCDLGYYWNNATLIPENNNHGWGTIERIKAERYPHLLTSHELWPNDRNNKPGFPTDERTKGLAITALRNFLDGKTGVVNDTVTIEEMTQYVKYDSGRFGPADEKHGHDDCVMSLAIGVYSLKHLGIDESYAARARLEDQAAMVVTGAVGAPPKRKARRAFL